MQAISQTLTWRGAPADMPCPGPCRHARVAGITLNVARAVAREADATLQLANTVLFSIAERLQNGDRSPAILDRLSRSMALRGWWRVKAAGSARWGTAGSAVSAGIQFRERKG